MYRETGEIFTHSPESLTVIPLTTMTAEQLSKFESEKTTVYEEIGSPAFLRQISGDATMKSKWLEVQPKHYRYRVANGMVRSIIGEYLATEVIW